MIVVSEYAAKKGVSARAVYKQLHTHAEELQGHTKKVNGKTYLDDDAVRILDAASKINAVVVADTSKDAEIADLRARVDGLTQQLLQQQQLFQTEIVKRDDKIAQLTDTVLQITTTQKKHWWQR